MPAPTPIPLRQALCRRAAQGQPASAIARALGLSARTVRHLLRRPRGGPDRLAPDYGRCGRRRGPAAEALRAEVLARRRQHPSWGAGLLRVLLQRDHPRTPVPAERTLQRWLRQAGLAPAPRGRRPAAAVARAQQPHAVWQVDAAEQIRLRGGQRVSWLRLVDECSGAVLETTVFPPGKVADGAAGRGADGAAPRLRPLGAARRRAGG